MKNIIAVSLFSALMLILGGCNAPVEAPSPTGEVDASDAPPAAEETAPPNAFQAGCISLREWQAAGQGVLEVEDVILQDEETAEEIGLAVRFTLIQDGKTYQGEIHTREYDSTAVTIDESDVPDWTQVCLGHVFVANFPAERGGNLFIANQYQDKLLVTNYIYSSGDEDTAEVRFRNGAINVRNSADPDEAPGWNLVEETDPAAALPHAYVHESVRCRADDGVGSTFVDMPVDAAGQVTKLDYLSVMSGGTSCGVDAARDDRETLWSDEDNRTRIAWKDEDYPSEITITREGDLYTIDARRMAGFPFCGQSSQLADVIKLRRGKLDCEHVQWPTAEY